MNFYFIVITGILSFVLLLYLVRIIIDINDISNLTDLTSVQLLKIEISTRANCKKLLKLGFTIEQIQDILVSNTYKDKKILFFLPDKKNMGYYLEKHMKNRVRKILNNEYKNPIDEDLS